MYHDISLNTLETHWEYMKAANEIQAKNLSIWRIILSHLKMFNVACSWSQYSNYTKLLALFITKKQLSNSSDYVGNKLKYVVEISYTYFQLGFLSQMVRNSPTMQETRVQSLSQEDPLEKGMATHSTILAWRISWTEDPGGLQVWGVAKSQTWLSN